MTVTCNPFRSRVRADDVLFARPTHLGVVEHSPAQMVPRERLLLYATVFALAPSRCLEIGVAQGGSSRILHAALSDLGQGQLVSIDPSPAADLDWSEMSDRGTLLVGSSPGLLARAREIAGGAFDFAFVDGDHSEEGVFRDLAAIVGVTEPGGHVLLHDAYFPPVAAGIERALREISGFRDAGMVSRTPHDGVEGEMPMRYGGLRHLVRVSSSRPSLLARVFRRRR